MLQPPQLDRRQYERLTKYIGLMYFGLNKFKCTAMTNNISLGGISFLTRNPSDVNSEIHITILKGTDIKPIHLEGKVIRCIKQGNGYTVASAFIQKNNILIEDLQYFIYNCIN